MEIYQPNTGQGVPPQSPQTPPASQQPPMQQPPQAPAQPVAPAPQPPMQQAPPQESAAPYMPAQSPPGQTQDGYKDYGWSWGAATWGPWFLVATRQYVYIWLYLFALVPFVNLLAIPALFIFLGLQGRSLAMKSRVFQNKDQYLGFMKANDHSGFAFFIFMIIMIVFYVTIVALVLGAQARIASELSGYEYSLEGDEWNYDNDFPLEL